MISEPLLQHSLADDHDHDVETQQEELSSSINEEIRLITFSKEHCFDSTLMTLREYPVPENIFAMTTTITTSGIYGVVAVDAENNLAGYYVGKIVPPFGNGTVGFGKKKVANLAQICVSSKYQKRGIAQRMGKFMLDGRHPDFQPDDYDEIIIQDTDMFNSPSWLFSDRLGFRYFPTHDIIRRLGLSGYIQLVVMNQHTMPGQFLKRLVKSEEEADEADRHERQKGVLACFVSGLLPCTYYTLHYVIFKCRHRGGVKGIFVACIFGVVYLMLAVRFLLAHLLRRNSTPPPVFREYDFWWGIIGGSLGHVLTIIVGFPLFGWTGGFYLGLPDINYRKEENQRAIALLYLPISLFTLALFLAHTLLRVFQPSFLLNNIFVDVLGTASFFFSVTDIAMFIPAVPSGAVAIRRWNMFVYAALLLSWLTLLVVTMTIPDDAPGFLDLSSGACSV